jgi:hypothetical protein
VPVTPSPGDYVYDYEIRGQGRDLVITVYEVDGARKLKKVAEGGAEGGGTGVSVEDVPGTAVPNLLLQ